MPKFKEILSLVAIGFLLTLGMGGIIWLSLESLDQTSCAEAQEQLDRERLDSLKAVGDGICLVSWYGESYHGRPTATRTDSLGRQKPGPPYDMYAHTCAHRSLPFGTVVVFHRMRLTDTCEVTDRGPYINGREYDLSYGAAQKLKMLADGIAVVRAEVIR